MTSPVDPLGGRGAASLRLSRRSLIAAGAIVATVGSTSVARAFSHFPKSHLEGSVAVHRGQDPGQDMGSPLIPIVSAVARGC